MPGTVLYAGDKVVTKEGKDSFPPRAHILMGRQKTRYGSNVYIMLVVLSANEKNKVRKGNRKYICGQW